MSGYIRQDTGNSIADGNIIDPDIIDSEYDAIVTAFDTTSGHTHDGSTGEGAPITKIGPSQDVIASATELYPKTDNTVDLGTSSLKFKDGYFAGTLSVNTISISGSTTYDDDSFSILDNLDNTKIAVFQASGITTGTTRTFTFPDASGTLTLIDATQTLTNKTLTSPTINGGTITGITDITVADGGTGASTASGARTNLGVAIGSDVQAYDAGLASIAGLTTVADKMIYTTASDTYAVADLTAAGRALLDDADASAQRTTLGLGTMAVETATDYMPKTGGTFTGEVKVEEFQETVASALSGTTPSVDVSAGTYFTLTTSGNTTFTFTNPAASGTVAQFTLEVTAGGTHTLTWPASVDWTGGTAPEAPANGETDILTFVTRDGGTTWYGFIAGDAMA